jgi:hypothetical protein
VQPFSLNVIGSAPVAFSLAATDVDGDPLNFAYTTVGVVGKATGAAPNLLYTPPVSGSGTMIVGYMANDGQANSGAGFVFISYNPVGNPPPVVALVTPATNLTVAKSTPVTLTATASDADGIKKVEFYVGASLVGTAIAAPYSVTWSTALAGRYQVVAKAYDNLNASTYTQPTFVTVP